VIDVAGSHGVRLFIAVAPPLHVIEQMRALPRPAQPGVRWTPERTWHITLRFLGELPEPDPLVAVLDCTDLGPSTEVHLGPRTRRLNANVLVVTATGLDDLAARVRAATSELGEPPGTKPFDGHLTIARRRRRSHARLPAGDPVDACFVADEIILFSSVLSKEGAEHEAVARWRLGEPEVG
jgi:RNA 2',3'-cyclic 3'-phosphodiesterase